MKPEESTDYSNKIKTSLYWWLSYTKPFIINGEYKLELLHIDRLNNSAKIRITNLKDGTSYVQEAEHG